MAWDERQVAMLRAIGLRVWQPAAATVPVPASSSPSPVTGAAAMAEEAVAVLAPAAAVPPPSSRRAQLDWPALRQAVAGCRACSLCESRTQTVFGVGHPQARWMVVGEAPGEQEDRQGEPFVGPSGQLLDAMLHALGVSRAADGPPEQRVYIANTLKCRPPGNRNPLPEELQRCEGFLIRQIELVQPRVIVAMGNFAVRSLLRSHEPVGRLRGRVHRYQGVPLIVTYHPAYLLRQPAEKARAWDDLCLAVDAADAEAATATPS